MEGTILVVDDEERNLKMMEAMLLPEGYRVLKAKNGQIALDLLKSENVDVVLLDIVMPVLSGFDVLKSIRENRILETMPVIVLSSLIGKEERIKCLQLGADDFILKPYDLDELRAKINTQVKLSYLRRQLNERTKLVKVMNRIDEGIILTDNSFVPLSVNLKAKKLLEMQSIPENILLYLSKKYKQDIGISTGRSNYILKQELQAGNPPVFFSLTIDQIKDVSDAIESYLFVVKKVE